MTQALPKPRKRKVETYVVDDLTITFSQVDPDLGLSYTGEPAPQQRSKWEVRVSDELVGFAFYPTGVGRPWVFTSLEPKGCYESYSDSFIHAWEPPPPNPECDNHPIWARYSGLLGKLHAVQPWRQDIEPDEDHGEWAETEYYDWKGWTSRAHIAGFIPSFKRAGRLPNAEEAIVRIAAAKQARADRVEQAKARAAQEKIDRANRAAEQQRLDRERVQRNKDTLEGLSSIRDRLGASLTNFEAAAIAEAVKRYGGAA